MGFFRRSKTTKSSTGRHAAATVAVEAETVFELPSVAVARTEPALFLDDAEAERLEDSDVFVCDRSSALADRAPTSMPRPVDPRVTLYVYGWHNVEPGPLSWAFPSLRSALDAVRTMRNAVQWCIVAGSGWTNVDHARSEGAVLVEQLG